jgi:hypothetical protein
MRPMAFLDPGAFIVTDVVKLPTRRLLARNGLRFARYAGRDVDQTTLQTEQSCGCSDLPAVIQLLQHVLYALANLTPALIGIGP